MTVVLRDARGQAVTRNANGAFSFALPLDDGSAYAVRVWAQPARQTCTVTRGTGTARADVTDVAVTCTSGPPGILVDAATINQALADARPGDVFVLRDGTYQNLDVVFRPTWTSADPLPIVLRPQSPGGVTFTGTSSISMTGTRLQVDGLRWLGTRPPSGAAFRFRPTVALSGCTECVFSNNTLDDAGPQPTESSGSVRVELGSSHNLITRNRFDRLPAMGVRVMCLPTECTSPHNTISYNHWSNKVTATTCGTDGATLCNNGESLQLGQGQNLSPLHTLVEHNLFSDLGPSAEMVSNKTADNTYRGNTFRNVEDQLVLRGGARATVRDNWFFTSRGIRVHDRGHSIFNNYIDGSTRSIDNGIMVASGGPTCPHLPVVDVRIAHNTIIGTAAQGIFIGFSHGTTQSNCVWTDAPTNTLIENNVIVNSTGNAIQDRFGVNSTYRSNVTWSSGTGRQGYSGAGVVQADPRLRLVDGLWRLDPDQSDALIRRGVPTSYVFADAFGRPRSPTLPTVGAEEPATALPTTRPLVSGDVGPGSTTVLTGRLP